MGGGGAEDEATPAPPPPPRYRNAYIETIGLHMKSNVTECKYITQHYFDLPLIGDLNIAQERLKGKGV